MSEMPDMKEFNKRLVEEFRSNSGQLGGRLEKSKILLLTTIGARTGMERTTPIGYGKDGNRLVVIAANAGAPKDPDWYFNLVANPNVVIELPGEKFRARAIVADAQQRKYLVDHAAEIVPYFDDQQKKTDREIPFVIFERVG